MKENPNFIENKIRKILKKFILLEKISPKTFMIKGFYIFFIEKGKQFTIVS